MSFLSQLLEHYHLTSKDLDARAASGSFEHLKTPYGLPDFGKVVERLKKAISQHEKCVIYGDYDVDGLTSTAILKLALDEKGLHPGFFIPSRYVEGYGLHPNRVKQFVEKGYHLLITVDNGISALDAIDLAKKEGMDVIVIDHHDVPETLPKYDFCFHHRMSGFLDYDCSAASLAYFVASGILGRNDDYLATLAGIAVFSDVMPLVGNNLEFAKMMLSNLNKYHYENLCYLINREEISYDDVTFSLIPALNAVGRVKKDSLSTNNACRFLIERKDRAKIRQYGDAILSANVEKKQILQHLEFDPRMTLESEHALCLKVKDYSGLAGLYANRLMREKKIPVAVFAPDEKDQSQLIGSIRAPEGYHLDTFLSQNRSSFLASGGHEKACGLTIRESDYFKVCILFATECAKQALLKEKKKEDSISITLDEINKGNYQILTRFMPFGEGFEAPLFKVTLDKEDFSFSPNGKGAFALSKDRKGKVVVFSSLDTLRDPQYSFFEVCGNFKKETYHDMVSYQIIASELNPFA